MGIYRRDGSRIMRNELKQHGYEYGFGLVVGAVVIAWLVA